MEVGSSEEDHLPKAKPVFRLTTEFRSTSCTTTREDRNLGKWKSLGLMLTALTANWWKAGGRRTMEVAFRLATTVVETVMKKAVVSPMDPGGKSP